MRTGLAIVLLSMGLGLAARGQQVVDRVVARVRDDVITESDLRELGSFQKLVDGKEQTTSARIRELAEQWVVQQEASLTGFQPPGADETGKALASLGKRFGSAQAFAKKLAEAGLTEGQVKRMLARQIFLSRFLDYKFRPEVQVSEQAIEAYYRQTLVPELERERQAVPALENVADKIREVLVERGINERAQAWLDEMQTRWKVQRIGGGPSP